MYKITHIFLNANVDLKIYVLVPRWTVITDYCCLSLLVATETTVPVTNCLNIFLLNFLTLKFNYTFSIYR